MSRGDATRRSNAQKTMNTRCASLLDMTVGELLAMFAIKDPEALPELQAQLDKLLETIAAWGESARQWVQSLDPSTREFITSFAKAHAAGQQALKGQEEPHAWWMEEPTISVLPPPAPDPRLHAEMDAVKARMRELEQKFEAESGRSVPDAFPPKKNRNDPN